MTPKRPSPRRSRTAARGLMTFSSPTFSGRRREVASWPAASLPRGLPLSYLSSTSLPMPGGTSPPSGAVRNFLYRPTRSRVSSDQSAGRNNLRSATLGRPRLSGGSSMRQTPEHLRRDRDLHFCERHSALPGFPNHPISVPSGRSTPGSTAGLALDASRSAWLTKASTSKSPDTTSAAGARPSTRLDGALAHERDGHWMGANAVARHAARGVGGVEDGRQHRRMNGSNDQHSRVRTQARNRP